VRHSNCVVRIKFPSRKRDCVYVCEQPSDLTWQDLSLGHVKLSETVKAMYWIMYWDMKCVWYPITQQYGLNRALTLKLLACYIWVLQHRRKICYLFHPFHSHCFEHLNAWWKGWIMCCASCRGFLTSCFFTCRGQTLLPVNLELWQRKSVFSPTLTQN
jgi:hypothetical protein